MLERLVPWAILIALISSAGCRESSESNRPFLTRTFQTPDGQTAHYVLFVPPNRDPAEKLPVILFLNGWGENGNDGLRQISNNFGGDMWRMRAWFPFLAVCPQCTYNAEWTPGSPNEQLALGVLDAAIREFNGDPDRVTISGASTGGTGALNIAMANPDRFAAVVPVSAPLHVDPSRLAQSGLAIWGFHNGGDTPALVDAARSARLRHFQAGTSPRVTEFDLAEHNAWDPAYSSPALYRWLLAQHRRRSDPFAPYQLLTPSKLLDEWTDAGSGWRIDRDELISPAGPTRRSLTSPAMGGDWAIHFDLQLASGAPAVIRLLGSEGVAAVLQLPLIEDGLADLASPDGSATAIDNVAQRALRSGWNDIRLEFTDGRLGLVLNGWPAMQSSPAVEDRSPLRIAIEPGSSEAEGRVRYIRVSSGGRGVRP